MDAETQSILAEPGISLLDASFKMSENEIAAEVVDICYHLHKQYGPGLFETVYEELICYELAKRAIPYQRQFYFSLMHEGRDMDKAFRADVVVGGKVILELKSVERLPEVYFKQVVTYLKITGMRLGLLINFKTPLIKDGIHRIVNNL